MLELYNNTNSVCAQKVRLALTEKGLQAREHTLKLQGDQFDPAYLKLNPNCVVPTLVHDGLRSPSRRSFFATWKTPSRNRR
jgi:glutathione S-transferase